jgi:hypothetical protein
VNAANRRGLSYHLATNHLSDRTAGEKRALLGRRQPDTTTATTTSSSSSSSSSKYQLHIINVGDSRILLSRKNGEMIVGHGTDGGLTTDHNPDNPSEAVRFLYIYMYSDILCPTMIVQPLSVLCWFFFSSSGVH